MKLRTLPATATLAIALIAGATGGAFALQAGSPAAVVEQTPTVRFESTATEVDIAPAASPSATATAQPAEPVAQEPAATDPAPKATAPDPVEQDAPSAPKARVAAVTVEEPAPARATTPTEDTSVAATPVFGTATDPGSNDRPEPPAPKLAEDRVVPAETPEAKAAGQSRP